MHCFGDNSLFGIELIFSLLIIVICFFIYFKTNSAFRLTKHKGIRYFRATFLFFGIAYVFRFLLRLSRFTSLIGCYKSDFIYIIPISLILTSYASTVAIFYLFYSMMWKRIKCKYACLFIHIIALFIAIISFIYQEPLILIIVQGMMLIIAILLGYIPHKIKNSILFIYLLLVIFWIIALIPLSTRLKLIPKCFHPLHVISIVILLLIYYKIKKWLK